MIMEVAFGSPLYAETLVFREDHLRRPLGLRMQAADTAGEAEQIHVAAVDGGRVRGTVVLKPASPGVVKLRQMAVAPEMRGTGLAQRLVGHAEDLARARGFSAVEMAARATARRFYERLGYAVAGDGFLELTIPHVRMTKRLDEAPPPRT